jgi:hypothetical protein
MPMTYARARLWTGITGVGLLVTLSTLALAFDLPERLGGPYPRNVSSPAFVTITLVGEVLTFAALLSLALLPVEWVGGVLLARKFNRTRPSPLRWWLGWLRGNLVQLGCLALSSALILIAARDLGLTGAVLAYAFVMVVLVFLQPLLAVFVGGFRTRTQTLSDGTNIRVFAGQDPAFTGGIAGVPGLARVIVPSRWFDSIGEAGVRTLVARRMLIRDSGWRLRGLLAAAAFNLSGFALVLWLGDLDAARPTDLIRAFLGSLLFSFFGLLILPLFARRAVLTADRAALDAGLSRDDLVRSLEILDPVQDDEPERSAALESIFHPVASLRGRIGALADTRSKVPQGSCWHIARNALFLSWAGFGSLARAVHCNSGKPELWVLLPSD